MMQAQPPYPTHDLVNATIVRFDQEQRVPELTLTKIIKLIPQNNVLEDIYLKVIVLNDIYRTSIWATYGVAAHILTLDIDPMIKEGRCEAVDQIAHLRLGGKVRNNYSFATKYCAWHNPDAYPIFDSFVGKILWCYQKQDEFDVFRQQDLLKYSRFKQIVRKFQEHYHLTHYSHKNIDKYLWLTGKQLFPAPWG